MKGKTTRHSAILLLVVSAVILGACSGPLPSNAKDTVLNGFELEDKARISSVKKIGFVGHSSGAHRWRAVWRGDARRGLWSDGWSARAQRPRSQTHHLGPASGGRGRLSGGHLPS